MTREQALLVEPGDVVVFNAAVSHLGWKGCRLRVLSRHLHKYDLTFDGFDTEWLDNDNPEALSPGEQGWNRFESLEPEKPLTPGERLDMVRQLLGG